MIQFSSLLLPLFVTAAVVQPPQQAPTLRLGTWNLEFLGAEGNFRNNLPPRTDADYAAIGKKVRELGVHVLAVQEICGEAPLRKVATAAGPGWELVLGTSGGWDDGKTSQQLGFLYDTSAVDLLFAEELATLPRTVGETPIFHRVPLTAGFRHKATGFDFRAITVHLKAGQKPLDHEKRRLEAAALRGWLDTLLGAPTEDQDLVLLGDFNSSYGSDPERIFETGGGLQYLEASPRPPTILHFDDPIDHIAVGPGLTEAVPDTFAVHSDFGGLSRDRWRQTYSDHLPVTVTITAQRDEDPAATFARVGPAPAPARAASAQAQDPAGGKVVWPPKVGTQVRVTYGLQGDLRNQRLENGSLAAELPSGPAGWVVLRTAAGVMGIPYDRVLSVEIL